MMQTKMNDTETLNSIQSEFAKYIANQITQGIRITEEEGLQLLTETPSEDLQHIADHIRKVKSGDTVFYASTLFIHPTNLCELSCPMCSFYAKPGWKTAWFLTPDKIIERVAKANDLGINEVHFVGGLWRDCDLDYYHKCFTGIKKINPDLHIKALTPVEYDFLATHHGIPIEEVFKQMMEWGLGSLPGGGAEILVEEIRKQVAPQKITSDQYMEIHAIAHQMGLSSNITMLYGHVEDEEHIITHLSKVREQQDRTSGFNTFVPLKYHDENNALGKRKKRLKPKDAKRVFAVSRIMLDNVPHLKVLWNYLGIEEGLELLNWGGDDFASTATDEKIIVMAGGVQINMTEENMQKMIREQGRTAHKVHSR